MLEAGVRDVRNQGVLMRGVNATAPDLLDLCFALLDGAGIMPYYFYMCDMIPNAEHWRVSVWEAQALQHGIMGYLPGFATPRIVCDVPLRRQALGAPDRRVRPRARHLVLDEELPDRHRDRRTPRRSSARYEYYDPIHTLPAGRARTGGASTAPRPSPRPMPAARSTADPNVMTSARSPEPVRVMTSARSPSPCAYRRASARLSRRTCGRHDEPVGRWARRSAADLIDVSWRMMVASLARRPSTRIRST